jgi:hypothetical protein
LLGLLKYKDFGKVARSPWFDLIFFQTVLPRIPRRGDGVHQPENFGILMFQQINGFLIHFQSNIWALRLVPQDLEMPGHVFTPKQLNANLLWVD